jgi:hypothetical protein
MTQDEIIRMAREAGLIQYVQVEKTCVSNALERFAALVAAHTTQTLTKAHEDAFQSYVDQAKADRELEALAARLAEREECAKVCDERERANLYGVKECAAAIRARGSNEQRPRTIRTGCEGGWV